MEKVCFYLARSHRSAILYWNMMLLQTIKYSSHYLFIQVIAFDDRVCLRAWLEHDTVCPTCRISLSDDLHQGGRRGVTQGQGREERGGRRLQRNIRNAHNWLFRFNGASIASWLPTFSVELHQEDLHWVNDAEELHRVVSVPEAVRVWCVCLRL